MTEEELENFNIPKSVLIKKCIQLEKQLTKKDKRIAELEAQIEKMKNCKNCANYMISGKCPGFYKTGWCKNWEMTKGDKRK